ncbi:MAG TPA: NPCBM/NEW2 domain-containing protein, partial [Armatimonadota bacterium]|nr:NPCBM/NEW2 domain-containing protein [Armatimonadota bacterium]
YGNLWWWDTEFWANFKNDYTYETNKSVVYLDGYRCDYGKPGGMRVTDIYLMQAAKKDTVDRMLKGGWLGDAFHHKFAEIVKQVGWEPMKKVFRWYFTLSPEERQVDLLCNRSLFIHAIEEQSGVNISEQFIDWGFSHLTVADGAAEDAKEIGRMFRAKKWSVDIVERPIYAAPGEKVTVQVDVLEQDPVYFEKGLGTHPRSEIVYNLDGKYKTFESLIGIAGKANAEIRSGSVGFELIADGKRIYSSPVLKGGGMYRHVKQDISGVKELKLVTNDGGNGIYGDGCAWVDTKVIDANGKVTYLSDLKPVSVKQEYGELSPDADLDGNQLMFLYNPCKKPVKVVGRLNGKTFEFRHGSQPETYEYTFDGFSKGKHYVWLTINVDDDPITQHELVTIIVKDKE